MQSRVKIRRIVICCWNSARKRSTRSSTRNTNNYIKYARKWVIWVYCICFQELIRHLYFRRLHWSATIWISSRPHRLQRHHNSPSIARRSVAALSFPSTLTQTTPTMTSSTGSYCSGKCSSKSHRHLIASPTTPSNRNPSDVLTNWHTRRANKRSRT